MDSSVAPVVRGEFLYRDVLLVDVGGELKRHARAPEADIRRFLNGKEVKDQVGHWYEAQLIHYGLQRSKDKNAAKVRLQQALNQGKLKSAPPHLVDMEAQMKKEYAAALRKARSQIKAAATSKEGKKRARDEDESQVSAKKTKITLNVDGVSINIDQSVSSATKKQKSAKSATIATPKETENVKKTKSASTTPKKAAATPKRNQNSMGWTGDPRDHPENVFQRSASQSNQATPAAASKPKKARSESVLVKKETIKKEVIKKEPAKRGSNVKNEPLPDSEAQYDEYDDQMDTRPDMSQDQISVTGVYNLSCPQLAAQIPDHADKFRLFLCVDNEGGRIWGGFELGWKSGTIKIDDIAWSTQLSFGWRSRDYEQNNSLRFGKGCFGEIELCPGQQVCGVFHNLFPEPLRFEGTRRPGPLWCGKSAYKFQSEWDQYPKDAYGR